VETRKEKKETRKKQKKGRRIIKYYFSSFEIALI